MHEDDVATIAAYLRGERASVALIERWLTLAAAPFRRALGPEWEDAVQEARLDTFRQLKDGRFRGDARLKTYLGRVACLTCLDALRRRRRRPRLEGEEAAIQVPSTDPSPLDHALRHDSQRSLGIVFAAAAPECRELWHMIQEGLSYREMSARMSVAEGTLRVRVHRCRRRAVEALDGKAAADQETGTDGLS
jgi:RNA polymerase sigma-70 factor (ECF subfamily)